MNMLYRFEAELLPPAPIGPISTGIRTDFEFRGELVAGELAGGRGWGSEYLLLRPDGVGMIDARDTFEIPGGYLHAQAKGFVLLPDGVVPPTLEEMTAPDFEPADVRMLIHGYALCQTAVPEYEHLNRTLVKIDGWVNNATRELVFEGRAVGAERAIEIAAGPGLAVVPGR